MQNSGRSKDLEKRQRILEAAKNIFLKQGYHHAGMNQIAQMAGVTKLTVYNHFQDKANLFVCAIEESCETYISADTFQLQPQSDFKQQLASISRCALHTIYLPEALKLDHVLYELAAEKSPLVKQFFAASHQRLCNMLTHFFEQASKLGLIQADDPLRQTELILSLLLGLRHQNVLLGIEMPPTPDELELSIQYAIEIFMLKYSP
ncbi:TetR/AcrR family transcriptional regulator [Acinetobacter soli]|uniref:TetR/AcrR family transcriptional regulator n=1 Tax=Acinetobacter soli TaxID=487316 RepID=UPI001ABD44AF|nr:TetR/AcrR family transcriptional regulator [Acinetobacter soli]